MKNILLIGAGPMAIAYAEVLQQLNVNFTVIGRGVNSCAAFKEKTNITPVSGGIDQYVENNEIKGADVIVATGTEVLMPILLKLIKAGVSRILVEKPAAISIEELLENEENLLRNSTAIFVAYNRRFYASVGEAKKIIEKDGGLLSMHFEFTEWSHVIDKMQKAPGVKENIFFSNSTHVIDLAFYIAGSPQVMSSYSQKGNVTWHEKTNFSGAGITDNNVLFSYISNWESAGRWALELLTNKRRIYLKPLEGVGIQMKGTVNIVEHDFDASLDKEFKPGLFKQASAFLHEKDGDLLALHDHIFRTKNIYQVILEGSL